MTTPYTPGTGETDPKKVIMSLQNIAGQMILAASTPTWTGLHTFTGSINITGAPGYSVSAIANPYFGSSSLTLEAIQATSASATVPETGFQSIITSAVGSANAGTAFKIGAFISGTFASGSANGYGANVVAASSTGFNKLLTGLEVDLNQGSGLAQGVPGATNASYNVVLSGNNSAANPATAALWITGTTVWTNGIYVSNGVITNTITDASSSAISYVVAGSHSYALDTTQGTFAGPVLHFGNNQTVAWRNAANNADLTGINVNSSNQVVLGGSGVVGVTSTINPAATGTAAFALTNSHATAADIVLNLQGGTATAVDATTLYVNFVNPGNTIQRGTITANDSAGTGHVAYNTASDERLKKSLGPMDDALERLNKIEVHRYQGRDYHGSEYDIGFFAQNLHKTFPWAVTPSDHPDYQARPWQVDYGRVTPLLVAAVQELTARVATLETELTTLKKMPWHGG